MVIVQSLDSKFKKDNFRFNSIQSMLNCMELSVRMLHSIGMPIMLITDTKGLEIVRPISHLYDDVKTDLNHVPYLGDAFWMLGKIYAYSRINQPFIHIDNDVIFWGQLPEFNDIIVQSYEYFSDTAIYKECLYDFKGTYEEYLPNTVKDYAVNMGIFGVKNNFQFLTDFYNQSLDICSKISKKGLKSKREMDHSGVFIEQYMIHNVLKNREVMPLYEGNVPPSYYSHLIAWHKKNPKVEQMIIKKLNYLRNV